MLPVTSHPIAPGNTTKELAEFLRSTAPPWYDQSLDPQSKSGLSAHKKSAFGFLRTSTTLPKPQPIHPDPIFLPESVTVRTSTNGKRYLHISLPTEQASSQRSPSSVHAGHTSEDGDQHHENEPESSPNRSGRGSTGIASGAPSGTFQGSGGKPVLSSSSWNTGKSELSDTDTVDSYHSYLRAQTTERSLLKGGARFLGKPRRPASIDVVSRGPKKDLQFRRRSNTPDNSIYIHNQTRRGANRTCDATVVSTTPSYKSVYIHSHGLPPRRSSITKTRLFLPSAHLTMAHESLPRGSLTNHRPNSPQEHHKDKRTSTQSANTIAETVRSDASSSVTTDAESTPSLSNTPSSAFSFNTAVRTLPRPGPAPTRALPSLPEGHDTSTGSRDRPASLFKLSATPDRLDVKSGSTSLRQIEIPGASDHTENVSETLRASRKNREERVRERKMRDLQSTRARRDIKKSDNTQHQEALDNEEKRAEARNSHTSATTSSSSTSGSRPRPGRTPSVSSSLQGSTVGLPREIKSGLNSFSPIMLVVEQKPVAESRPPEQHPIKKSESVKQLSGSLPGSYVHSRSPSPSLPSSDDDSARKTRITKKGSLVSSATTAAAFRAFEAGTTVGKEVEIEARLVAVEKKNALLESALMAVLQSTAQISTDVRPSPLQGEPPGAGQAVLQSPPSLDALVQSLGVSSSHDSKSTASRHKPSSDELSGVGSAD